jgi:hypothetical protein
VDLLRTPAPEQNDPTASLCERFAPAHTRSFLP